MCCQDRIYRWKYHFCIFPPLFPFILVTYPVTFEKTSLTCIPYYFRCHIREIPDLYLIIFPVTFEKLSLTCTLLFSLSQSRNHPWLVPYFFRRLIQEIIPDLYLIIFPVTFEKSSLTCILLFSILLIFPFDTLWYPIYWNGGTGKLESNIRYLYLLSVGKINLVLGLCKCWQEDVCVTQLFWECLAFIL